jgi:hypothetical protein
MYAVINPLILLVAPVDAVLAFCTVVHHTKGFAMTNNTSPAENEYLAAVAGLHEQTPSPAPVRTYAVGDFVSGESGGKRWSGRIFAVDGDRLSIEMPGAWLSVSAKDVTH